MFRVGFGYLLKCLSIRTLKTINFPFVPNGKLVVFGFLPSEIGY